MSSRQSLDALVRACDPATNRPGDASRSRQEELLRRLLADPLPAVRKPPRWYRPTGRWGIAALAAGLVVVLVAGLGVARAVGTHYTSSPPVVDGKVAPAIDHRDWPARDDWTQDAASLDSASADDLDRACIDFLRLEGEGQQLNPDTVEWRIAERRGSWEAAVYSLPGSRHYVCLTPVMKGHAYPEIFEAARVRAARTDVAPDQISMPPQGVACGHNYVEGRQPVCVWGAVGPRVKQVTVRSHHQTVHATVMNGYYLAWWPVPQDDERRLEETPHFDLTLDDGTVVHDAQPVR